MKGLRALAGGLLGLLVLGLVACGGTGKPSPEQIAQICEEHSDEIDRIRQIVERRGESVLERIRQRARGHGVQFIIEHCLDRDPEVPELQPTSIDRTVPTSFFEANKFLFQGDDPVQTGVDSGTMEFRRMAVVRGRVVDRSGDPVPGARVRVLDHPEFGRTLTREDGYFDMAVNGGGQLTVSVAHDGFLPLQRPLEVRWRDYAVADTMVMTSLDDEVTTVDLTDAQDIQVHRASVESDPDGQRQATLLFKPGTGAVAENSVTGETEPLSSLEVRVTEYTIGETGPRAMPAPLPPTSGYTYAAEVSTDQTLSENTDGDSVYTSVKFDQPAVYYLENFLGVPAGVPVPVGVLNRNTGNWDPRSDGWVIDVVGEAAGQALVDVNGDGAADAGDTLSRFGIDAAELEQIASLYDPGQSLWRVPLEGFSPIDFNYPVAAEDSESPSNPEAENCGGKTEDSEETDESDCSRIEIQNQLLGENIDLVGVPFDLHYRSERAPGFTPPRQLEIQLSGETIPDEVNWIRLEIVAAGEVHRDSFPAEPNQTTTFQWDGLDAYGRLVQGKTPISINIGYVYDAAFYRLPGYTLEGARSTLIAGGFESFTLISRQGEVLFRLPETETRGPRSNVTIWQRYRRNIGNLDRDAFPVGGWSLGIHHVYDPEGNILFKGNGRRRSAEFGSSTIIETVAGNGEDGSTGDRGPATGASIGIPHDVVTAPDGSFYIADPKNNRVRKVFPDGEIVTYAGGGNGPPSTVRVGARGVALEKPIDLALDSRGGLYIVEKDGHRVSRVSERGLIRVVAGTGDRGLEGNSGLATQAELNHPTGVDVASDGTIYIADRKNHQIRRITTSGRIFRVAGQVNGAPGFSGDGGVAPQAELDDPKDVDVGPDGSVFVADADNNRIRKITPDGDIRTVVGGGSRGLRSGRRAREIFLKNPVDLKVGNEGGIFFNSNSGAFLGYRGEIVWKATPTGNVVRVAGQFPSFGVESHSGSSSSELGDGGPATLASLNQVYGMSFNSDGELFVTDGYNFRVRKISSTLPGVRLSNRMVATPSGRRVFAFNSRGRHLRTVDAQTGTLLFQFEYDGSGNLVRVIDRDGQAATIERDDQGIPQAIVGPFGHRTDLDFQSDAFPDSERERDQVLVSVTNPADESHQMDYSSQGLLTGYTRPGGQTTSFTYDEEGRLVREEDPVGGFQEFEREVFDTGYTVTRTTAMGRQDSYNVSNLPTEDREMNNEGFDGLKRKKLRRINGQRRTRRPDNMEVNLQQRPDPRFGMMSPNQGSVNVQTPEGRSLDVSRSREVSTGNAVAVRSASDTFRLNGREWVQNFDGATRRTTTISPEGREKNVLLNDRARPSRIEQEGLLPIEHDYNEDGQLVESKQGDRVITNTYNSDGFLASVTDPVGRTTQFTYDPAGRVTSRTLPNGEQVEFQYDDNGNLTALTPPGRDAHLFRYTDREQMQDYEPPDLPSGATITTWIYNLDRQLARIQRPDMSTVNFSYDDAGRRQTLDYPTGRRTFNYSSSTGNLTGIQADAGVDLTFQYDGSLPTRTRWSGSQISGRLDLTYDDNFRVTELAVNGISVASRSYDDDGLLVGNGPVMLDRDPRHGLVTDLSVSAPGPGANALTTNWTYNDFGEVIASSTEIADSEFYRSSMQRDTAGRIVALSENLQGEPGRSRAYEYDDLGRLIGVDRGSGRIVDYDYDSNGNRVARTGAGIDQTDFSYDAQDRLLSYRKNGDTVVDFTYTANGELESRTVGTRASTTYDYDALGNLRSVTLEGDTTIEYVIDGQDRRVGKRVDGQLVKGFLYKDQLNPIAQLGSDGSVEAVFLYGQKGYAPVRLELFNPDLL